ncbi:double-stranded uracil-DNA glycosylase [Serratia marcescens]|uniref:Double-stranded uracil-DNA glycosylase n=1 Tax=Serratia marcescens TaxID=615 RepID=A0A939NMJ2_SERMA|nr:double-stranded uracil-DNA glycosylase [Serratia marcescens]
MFCGINPGLSSAHQGYPFANGSNRFWKVIHQAGFTESQLAPEQWQQLKDNWLRHYRAGGAPDGGGQRAVARRAAQRWRVLQEKILRYQPRAAILGKQAFATAFGVKNAPQGKQALTLKPRCGYCLTPAD